MRPGDRHRWAQFREQLELVGGRALARRPGGVEGGIANPNGQCRIRPSPVPCRSRRPGSRRLHAGHHLARQRAPARLVPGSVRHPGFDVICFFFDTSTANRLRSPSRSPPDASCAPFPHRSPRSRHRSRSMWWFEASPRRATPKGRQSFISCTAPHQQALPTSSPLPRSGRTLRKNRLAASLDCIARFTASSISRASPAKHHAADAGINMRRSEPRARALY